MSKNDNLIETVTKNKQVNVLLWFAVIVVIVVVCFLLYKAYRGEQKVEELFETIDNTLDSRSVSQSQIFEMRESIKAEYVTFSDMNTRVIDTLAQDGRLWGTNSLIQSAISCVEIGFDLSAMKIHQEQDGRLVVNLGKAKILNAIPNGKTVPLVVRFEGYIESSGDWTAADKMKHQDMVNEKMLRKCEEWTYYAKAREQAFQQIEALIKHKLDGWQKKDITITIEE